MKTATFFCFFFLGRLPTRKEERACLCSPQTHRNLFFKMRGEKRKGRGSDRVGFKSGYSDFARKDVSDHGKEWSFRRRFGILSDFYRMSSTFFQVMEKSPIFGHSCL